LVSTIYGGFDQLIYTSTSNTDCSVAKPYGVTTRLSPILDTSNINVRGTGRRGLYDILLGMRQPQFTMDILPTDMAFITEYQDGQTMPPYFHYVYEEGTAGLTFTTPLFNRISVEARHNEAIMATIEVWADSVELLGPTVSSWKSLTPVQPYRWLDSKLRIEDTDPVDDWWSWRYEVNNNLQRLGDADTGGTRAIKMRHKEVTGLIVRDLTDYSEWNSLMSAQDKFNITIKVRKPGSGTWVPLLQQPYCRWNRLEAPVGPEDLQAKRFPFTAIDNT